jgi:hypothetical protein
MVGTTRLDEEEVTTVGRVEMILVVVDSPAREEAAKELAKVEQATAPQDAVLSFNIIDHRLPTTNE